MRQSYRIIPIYTSDVSGVCSALYELGGMTVMHDPSGCNSTYNTHDEIRWYDQDSLIYISGLTEIDAIMGNDEKFLDDIKEAARELHPKFIALAGSPIPYMNGTDFPALAQVLEEETGIPAFAVPTNGMHDYVYGAGIALEEIAKRFTGEKTGRIQARTVNLLGVTPLDFGPVSHVEVLKENLKACGWKVLSTWAMGDELDAFLQAGEAEVNLVVSSVGLRAAKVLEEKFGTPYVVGTPIGSYTERIAKALEEKEQIPYRKDRMQGEIEEIMEQKGNRNPASGEEIKKPEAAGRQKKVTLIGEPVTMESLAAGIEQKYGCPVEVLCPLEKTEGLLCRQDRWICGEEEMEEALKDAEIIVADPLYQPICPKHCIFRKNLSEKASGAGTTDLDAVKMDQILTKEIDPFFVSVFSITGNCISCY